MSAFVSTEELDQLPRWAKVAFAARCARRIYPAFQAWDRKCYYAEFVQQAIAVAEESAANAKAEARRVAAIRDTAREAVTAATHSAAGGNAEAFNALAAAMAAIRCAESAIAASYRNQYATGFATQAAVNAAGNASENVVDEFAKILAVSIAQGWDDDSAVEPEFFC